MVSAEERYRSGEYRLLYDVPAGTQECPVEEIDNVVYGHSDTGRPLRLNILRPMDTGGEPRPAMIWIHGGGWGWRGIDDTFRQGAYINFPFATEGYFTATIEYTLTTRSPFPAQIHDCKAAVRWLRAHAGQYNVDPGRIGVWGRSAGGHLCSLLGTSGNVDELEGSGGWEDQSSRVNTVVDYFGPTDLTTIAGPHNGEKEEHIRNVVGMFLGGPIEENSARARSASPMTYISPEAAPTLIIHGASDLPVPFSQGQALYRALQEKGVPASLIKVRHAGHGLLPSEDGAVIEPSLAELYVEIRDFLKTHLLKIKV
jgi:acetyl esterase/lipase